MAVHLKNLTTRRKPAKLRPIMPTQILVNELFAIYADSIRIWAQAGNSIVRQYTSPGPITADAEPRDLQRLVTQADIQSSGIILYQTDKLGRWVSRVGEWHRH